MVIIAHRKNPEEKQRIGQTYFPDYNDLCFCTLDYLHYFLEGLLTPFLHLSSGSTMVMSFPIQVCHMKKNISVRLNLQPKTFFQCIYFFCHEKVKKLSCTLLTSSSSISQSFLAFFTTVQISQFILFSLDP